MQVKRGIPRKICLDLGQGSRILSFLESSLDGEINQVFNQEDAVTRCSSDQSSVPLLSMMAQDEPCGGVALKVGTVVQLPTT
jgi:hypothetical protein